MKAFKQYLLEADYRRFLKKNKNLTPEQRKEINDYFSKDNTHAAGEIDWQHPMTAGWFYNDFEDIMLMYKSGFKKKLKVKLPGSKGKDYWQIKLKSKTHLAYIPLTWEMAQYFNSSKFGVCDTGHCIGWTEDSSYWDYHMINEQEVPIYIISSRGKWVVIIERMNRRYQVWDKMNRKDLALLKKEPIPGFSIQKELMNSGMKKLYDSVRSGYYQEARNHKDVGDASADYIRLIEDINIAVTNFKDRIFILDKIIERTIRNYRERIDSVKIMSARYKIFRDEFDEFADKVLSEDEDIDYDIKYGANFKGVMYTKNEAVQQQGRLHRQYDSSVYQIERMTESLENLYTISKEDMFKDHKKYTWDEYHSFPIGRGLYDMDYPRVGEFRYSDYFNFIIDVLNVREIEADRVIKAYIFNLQGKGNDIQDRLATINWIDPLDYNQE